MGMGMGIRKYPLPGGDEDGSKVVYPLGLGMNFYYGDGIMIPVPAPLPSLITIVRLIIKAFNKKKSLIKTKLLAFFFHIFSFLGHHYTHCHIFISYRIRKIKLVIQN